MAKQFIITVLVFLFSASTIPDSLGCVKCCGKSAKGSVALDRVQDQATAKTCQEPEKIDRQAQPDPGGNTPCHFCLLEVADHPRLYEPPGLRLFCRISPLTTTKISASVLSVQKPPEFPI